MRVRKKPVEVEAFRFADANTKIPEWIISAINSKKLILNEEDGSYVIQTLEGPMIGAINDYIILGVDEEIYSCKCDIFRKTYDILD